MREKMPVICPTPQDEYFSRGDWTAQISLIALRFPLFWRIV
jgi:hypothetical protein